MPSIEKAERRDRQRRKEINGEHLGVRYRTLRAGKSLIAHEIERKTRLEGKAVKRHKARKGK